MDKIIISYHDACLYESDYFILKTHDSWLNDRIISFYFEYLQKDVFESESDKILFIGKKHKPRALKQQLFTQSCRP